MFRKGVWIIAGLTLIMGAPFPSFWYSLARLVANPFERLFGIKSPEARLLVSEPAATSPVQSATRRLMQPLGAVRLLRRMDESQR